MSAATTGSKTSAEDAWGLPSAQVLRRAPAQTASVPDDWDADDADEDDQDAQSVWETANARTPMPQIKPASTSSLGTLPPPAAAFEAPLRILKRPSASDSQSPSPLNGGQTQMSFKEREAQYQAARERIFGDNARDKAVPISDKSKTARANIIRDPIGPLPMNSDGEPKRGFRTRKKKTAQVPEGEKDFSSGKA